MQRRHFIRTGLLGAAALGISRYSLALAGDKPADPYHGLKMGMASYSLRMYPLEQALGITRDLGLRYICLKDVHLPLKSTLAERQAVHRKVEEAGLVLLGGGVITMSKNEGEIRNVFEYARDAGMPTIVASPDPDGLDIVEQMAKEFDIRVAIHNHGPGDKHWPSPLDALRAVESRDARLGLCIDVGHTIRLNEDPVAAIQRCAKRLYDFHLKDVSAAAKDGKPVVLGTGIIDIPGVLKALLAVNFAGHLGLEYEVKETDPLPGIKQSLAYVRSSLEKLA